MDRGLRGISIRGKGSAGRRRASSSSSSSSSLRSRLPSSPQRFSSVPGSASLRLGRSGKNQTSPDSPLRLFVSSTMHQMAEIMTAERTKSRPKDEKKSPQIGETTLPEDGAHFASVFGTSFTRIFDEKLSGRFLNVGREKSKHHRKTKRWNLFRHVLRERIFELKNSIHPYALFEPLKDFWSEYFDTAVVSHWSGDFEASAGRVVKADYHGCEMSVMRSKYPELVGLKGIVVVETEQTFHMVTRKNELKVIPKKGSVFSFVHHGKRFTLHGNHLCHRPAERTTRKYKGNVLDIDL
eukprot:TRINITY_DN82371_c0_g1_i1.p1 TRINITY_DN82371_c0_g1~~TRINITY_DN82371_c0_g1_i1.p1  ORF type:complete len:322 (+),score=78.50 TRINITY_DN82371_c0_g1_i1:84-968(+)